MALDHRSGIHAVLVVDDEDAVLKLIERQLGDLPFIIIPTRSGSEAMHILQTREISVLLCDLCMPHVQGTTVLKTALAANPDIVSIAVTGSLDPQHAIKALNEGGIWKCISKPWRREELVNAVSEAARLYAARLRRQRELKRLARDTVRGVRRRTDERERGRVPDLIPDVNLAYAQKHPLKKIKPRKSETARLPGLHLGNRYTVEAVIGKGGSGVVYKATDQLLNLPVAIKLLRTELTRNTLSLAALRNEARVAMQLSHRHIVRIHNLQEADGQYFLVMEYVSGQTLWDILRKHRRLPPGTVLQIVRVCADALSYAHRHQVLHNDLKPSNLMLDADGVLKIIDFGISSLKGAHPGADKIAGTPVYMSPEQIRGESLDERTDVYSLGSMVYEFLTGEPIFPHDTTDFDLLVRGVGELTGLPAPLQPPIQIALAPKRDNRWPSIMDFARALLEAAGSGKIKPVGA